MAVLTPEQVARLALDAGLTAERAKVAVAVAKGESGFDTEAVGDEHLVNEKWGPSVGLWQIRSLNAQRGTGKARDETRLKDPAFNARSMAEISSGGTNWQPWTVYKSGAYLAHLAVAGDAVRKALAGEVPPVPGSEPSPEEASVPSGVGAIFDPRTWVRVAWTVGGAALLLVGLLLVGRELVTSEAGVKLREWLR